MKSVRDNITKEITNKVHACFARELIISMHTMEYRTDRGSAASENNK
jgi:hypothetical protein